MDESCDFTGDCGRCIDCLAEILRDAIRSHGSAYAVGDKDYLRACGWVDEAIDTLVAIARGQIESPLPDR